MRRPAIRSSMSPLPWASSPLRQVSGTFTWCGIFGPRSNSLGPSSCLYLAECLEEKFSEVCSSKVGVISSTLIWIRTLASPTTPRSGPPSNLRAVDPLRAVATCYRRTSRRNSRGSFISVYTNTSYSWLPAVVVNAVPPPTGPRCTRAPRNGSPVCSGPARHALRTPGTGARPSACPGRR